ncbi:DUF427 domain-containing protein [Streptomyces sp. NPDC091376]|uniref:DUF427 domain-containing protein n=1 Tax=Streptomyces sp. NPDC091376 TaxID=3365994 RepID=UPI00381B90B2
MKDRGRDVRRSESVWDYPRPPRVEPDERHVVVTFSGVLIADTRRALRVLETSHPPTFYIPVEDVRQETLHRSKFRTRCEWKGIATYWDLQVGALESAQAAWSYESPMPGYQALASHFAFHAGRVSACEVDGQRVDAQSGDFYGGWITPGIVGPFKGSPGTAGW